ncbi:hypothetical protein TYRP_018326 [Tyrophagus putrescentiae]|nr:hypothetical protein TYRP_018326 [Tyrophagus putrescentiae]
MADSSAGSGDCQVKSAATSAQNLPGRLMERSYWRRYSSIVGTCSRWKKKKRKMSTVKHICPQMGCREEKTVAVEDLESNKMKKKEKGRKGEREWIWEKYPQIPILISVWICFTKKVPLQSTFERSGNRMY